MYVDDKLKLQLKILLLLPMALLTFGIYHGLLQTLYRAGVIQASSFLGIEYYQGLTAHGVINAIVLTTFFAVAFGHMLINHCLKITPNVTWAWVSTVLMVVGTVITGGIIFAGKASVLYTFYPPLKANPLFYIGLTLTVVGSWIAFYTWIPCYLRWRKENPDKKTPIPVVGILATFIVWQTATLPVAYEILFMLLPWSMGLTDGINVVLARTLFWFFGHPLVYFWLLPIYIMYYTMLPKLAGGKLYSDFAPRFSFLLFCVLSAPLGLHHQFADPGIATQWKGLHTVLTSLVAVPSLMTAFTLAASLEYGAKSRGGRGLFHWWTKLPYLDEKVWLFPYLFCGLVIFIFGGATGIVNASYSMNNVVHNTAWIPAHFHLTVGGPVFLGILGMSLFMLAHLFGKRVKLRKSAALIPYIWTVGVFTMSSGMFVGGFHGEPRRTNMGLTYLNKGSDAFHSNWQWTTMIAVVGGVLMTFAVIKFFYVLLHTLMQKQEGLEDPLPLAEVYHDENVPFVQNFQPWIIASVLVLVVAYIPPITDIIITKPIPAPPYNPDSPLPVLPLPATVAPATATDHK